MINILEKYNLYLAFILSISIVLIYLFFVFTLTHKKWISYDKRLRTSYLNNNFNIYNIMLIATWVLSLSIFIYFLINFSFDTSDKLSISILAVLLSAFMASSAAMKALDNSYKKDRVSEIEQLYKTYKILKVQIYRSREFVEESIEINDKYNWKKTYKEKALLSKHFASFYENHDSFSHLSINLISHSLNLATCFNTLAYNFNEFDELNKNIIMRKKNIYRGVNQFNYKKIENSFTAILRITDAMEEEIGTEIGLSHNILEIEKQTNIKI